MSPAPAPPAPPAAPEAAVDPRLRARRIAVRREEGRRRLRRLAVAGGVSVVALFLVALTRSPLLDVDQIEVRGAQHTPVAAAQAASGVGVGEPMAGVDLGAARRKLAALPWVDHAVVRRRWPGTVSIVLKERRAEGAAVARGGKWALVDRHARVLAVVPTPPRGLPRLEGLPPAGGPASTVAGPTGDLLLVARSLPKAVDDQVAAVVLAGEGNVHLRLSDGATVLLGSVDNLDAKLLALATLLEKVEPTGRDVLNVQVPGRASVSRRP